MKRIIKNSIKLFVFISIASLPFISVTQLIGMNNFLDSFENSEYYLFLENEGLFASKTTDEEYIIILKSSHPDFKIEEDDSIIYWRNDGEIVCNKIKMTDTFGALKKYQPIDNNDITDKSIYENQIIGKVINIIDNNIWNSISLKIWEISIQKLNFNSFFNND